MDRRNPAFLRALLLFLVAVGPLQAQTAFACAMMETVVHDRCCCDDHETSDGCAGAACDSALQNGDIPCCERVVDVGVQEAGKNTPVVQQAEVRSDVDPPQSLHSSSDTLYSSLPRLSPGVANRLPAAGRSGSDTYLVTQRLRI